jgi:hypothetical protein
MKTLDSQLHTISRTALTTITGGAGGLTTPQKIGVGVAAAIGWAGGMASGGDPENVVPQPITPQSTKPPYSISRKL